MSIIEQLSAFGAQHSGDFIIIQFATNEEGEAPPTLRGIIKNGLIQPEENSPYKTLTVFPRAGTIYQHIMTSTDGTSISGQFSPASLPSADEERKLLHELISAAAAVNERIKAEQAQAQSQRQELYKEAQTAHDERAQASQQANDLHHQFDDEVATARKERNAMYEELVTARQQRDILEARLSRVEASPQPSLPQQPQQFTAPPAGTTQGSDMTQMFAQLVAALRAPSQQTDSLVGLLHPLTASHGQAVSPLISAKTATALERAQFDVYRWPVSNTTLAGRLRLALAEMASLLEDPSRFSRWADHTGFTFSPTEWALWKTGASQPALELAAAAKIHDRGVQALLIFARHPQVDVTRLQDYASGATRVPEEPLLGSHNGHTNGDSQATSTTFTRPERGRGGRGGRARGTGNQANTSYNNAPRQVQGGGLPDLGALNALVRS